jgi:single-strand DNA-binding protein
MPTEVQSGDKPPTQAGDERSARNAVSLFGVLAEPGEERTLAGGLPVVRWTLRVPRGPELTGSDLIDCVALDADLQQRALSWPQGLGLELDGALRRRFFRTGGRTTTRVEVEVHEVREVADLPGSTAPAADVI